MLTHETINLIFEEARNPLAALPTTNLTEHFDKYCLPSSLRECVDQFRVDTLDVAMKAHGLVDDDLLSTTVRGVVPFRNFSEVFDPFVFFGDFWPITSPPGTFIVMPQVPSKAFCEYEDSMLLAMEKDIASLEEHVRDVPTEKVLGLAWAVAAFYLDKEPGFGKDRLAAIRYIALNNIQSHYRELAIKHETRSARTRGVTLPDMITRRKTDFRELFHRAGMPIDEREFDCMPLGDIMEYAADQRSVLLGHNRHIVFCSKCSEQLLRAMSQLQQCEDDGMVM